MPPDSGMFHQILLGGGSSAEPPPAPTGNPTAGSTANDAILIEEPAHTDLSDHELIRLIHFEFLEKRMYILFHQKPRQGVLSF